MTIGNRLLRGVISLIISLIVAAMLVVALGVVLPLIIYMYWHNPEYVGDGAVGQGMFIILTFLAALGISILPTVAFGAHVFRKLSPKT